MSKYSCKSNTSIRHAVNIAGEVMNFTLFYDYYCNELNICMYCNNNFDNTTSIHTYVYYK